MEVDWETAMEETGPAPQLMVDGGFGLHLVCGKVREQVSCKDCNTVYFCLSQGALLVILCEEMAAFI